MVFSRERACVCVARPVGCADRWSSQISQAQGLCGAVRWNRRPRFFRLSDSGHRRPASPSSSWNRGVTWAKAERMDGRGHDYSPSRCDIEMCGGMYGRASDAETRTTTTTMMMMRGLSGMVGLGMTMRQRGVPKGKKAGGSDSGGKTKRGEARWIKGVGGECTLDKVD